MKNTPEQIFDALLVLKCQRGDKNAFSLLVKRWHPKLCRQADWYLRDTYTARDIVQDSWSVIIKKISTLKDPNRFGSWARTIVSRRSVDWIKKNKKNRQELKEDSLTTEAFIIDNEDMRDQQVTLLLKMIKQLSPDHQLILSLFYLESNSMKEISDLLKISEGTVKSRLFHAREKLKSILKNKNHEERH